MSARFKEKKPRYSRVSAVVAALVFLVLPFYPARGQETETFEPEFFPLPGADAATPAGQRLQQGLTYYEQGNFAAASHLFYLVYSDPDSSDTLRYRATYELGRAMYRLGLYYPSLYFLEEIVTEGATHPFFITALPWLLRLARRLPGEPDLLERISQYSDYFPDQIEEKYRDQLAFLVGRYYYTRGLLDDAWLWFEFISPASRYYPQARYLQGMTHIQQYEGQPAVDAFQDVVVYVLQGDDRDTEARKLAEMALLAIARTFYSTGEYEKAIEYYDQLPSSSRYWLDALFEKAWALFQLEEYNRSLGNLHSLNSPFFNDEFYPEGMYLQAVIFFRNCGYNAVRETIEEYNLEYRPLYNQIADAVRSFGTDEEFYRLIAEIRGEQERDFSPQLQRLLNAAISDRTVQDAVAYVEEMDRELIRIQSMAQNEAAWVNSSVVDEILQGTELARNLGETRAGELVRIRVSRASNQLNELMSRSEAILVETDLMEHAVIDARLRQELNLSDTGLLPPPTDQEHLLWHFAGEYWRDELGSYWYAIRSRCSEVGLK
ncbi:MAG: tetratricopeptide repeat protein [Bradymonadales bacterium]|nr:tetratricopeptide repeat protein [Bradymonadales bacterium]